MRHKARRSHARELLQAGGSCHRKWTLDAAGEAARGERNDRRLDRQAIAGLMAQTRGGGKVAMSFCLADRHRQVDRRGTGAAAKTKSAQIEQSLQLQPEPCFTNLSTVSLTGGIVASITFIQPDGCERVTDGRWLRARRVPPFFSGDIGEGPRGSDREGACHSAAVA